MAQLMKAGPAIKRSTGSKKPTNKPAAKAAPAKTPEKATAAKETASKAEPKARVIVTSTTNPTGTRPIGINLREKAQEAIESSPETEVWVSIKQPGVAPKTVGFTAPHVAPVEPPKQADQKPPFNTTQPPGVPQPQPYQPSGYEEKGTAAISTQGHWGFGQLGQGYQLRK